MVTEASGDGLTIDELAQRTGMTVRNIRAHQSRGLLPPPEVRTRTGYYGPEHVARLELISELQADGFNLGSIKRLLEGAGDGPGAQELLGFKRLLTAPFESEQPELIDEDELRERFGDVDPKLLAKAERLGLVVPLGEGRYEIPSPALWRAGQELLALGIALEDSLRVVEQLNRNAKRVAEEFARLFLAGVWQPFEDAGRPEQRWPEVRSALERLRPLASEALLAVFQQRMTRTVEEAFGKALDRKR